MWARHRLEWITALVAVILGVGYLLLPPMGSDLAAQVARAGFFAEHGTTPVDLRWYAGVEQFGYSLVSQPVMALLGVRAAGVLTLVAGPVLLAVLFRRTGAARPGLGAAFGVAAFAGNLVSGRVTYGIGVCLGIAALVLLTVPRLRRLAAVAAFLASATSPVAGLFTGLAGVALLACRRFGDGLLLAVPAAAPLALTALLFGDGGWMNIGRTDTVRAVVTGLVVAVFVPLRPVRIGALLSSAGVLAAALIHTPVGLNATRLAVMFGLPALAAYATLPRLPTGRTAAAGNRRMPLVALVALLAVTFWWQPPVVLDDVRDIGNPTADPAYFAPLRQRLAAERLTGRVEIPPTRSYWESAHMGEIPLARGWLRQADIDRNPLFFTRVPGAAGTGVQLTPDGYRAWLAEQAVQFVAVPDAELAWPGRAEARMVTAGLPYLSLVWTDAHWRLYAVADPQPIVAAPAALVGQDATTVIFDAPAAGEVAVRVRYHRWFTVSGGAEAGADGDWTVVRVPAGGRYTLTSSLL
ncbi:hypothetical protein [Actinoplanes aureus]|uniref:Uncharacterized protein n=1 Tax=Actinoplanes aureus TaxID=2792083 RepID=A0A931CGN5_9ACTN|nr:hypothetical protein [Actinoplanes aureus]MBG0565788.1 hypothetical protein [Actinoplanes aureus]